MNDVDADAIIGGTMVVTGAPVMVAAAVVAGRRTWQRGARYLSREAADARRAERDRIGRLHAEMDAETGAAGPYRLDGTPDVARRLTYADAVPVRLPEPRAGQWVRRGGVPRPHVPAPDPLDARDFPRWH